MWVRSVIENSRTAWVKPLGSPKLPQDALQKAVMCVAMSTRSLKRAFST